MRRSLMTILVLVLLVGSLGSVEAAKKKKKKGPVARTAVATYDSPAIGAREATGVCSGANGCVAFPVGAEETSIVLEVADTLGQPVAITVGQESDPSNSTTEVVARTCAGKTEPIPIAPGIEVNVWLWVAPGLTPPCPGAASTGTVTATISTGVRTP